jgi:U3 small nucleolar RNA-associated protein 14
MGRKYSVPTAFASSTTRAPKRPRSTQTHNDSDTEVLGDGDDMALKPIGKLSREEDEEISEDDAFNETDEERYGELFNRQREQNRNNAQRIIKTAEELLMDDEEDFMEEEVEVSEASDFEDDPEAVDLSALLDTDTNEEPQKRKYPKLEHMSHESTSSQLNLNAMLSTLDDGDGEISNQLKRQIQSIGKLVQDPSKKHGIVSAPLAKRLQDKVDREVAYQDTVKEVSKWTPLIKHNRQAEHLKFPMNAAPKQNLSSAALAGKFKPETELENQVESILKASGMSDDKSIQQTEELAMNKLDEEELKSYRARLAKTRALLFYTEQKEKRAAKIKSKKYHRIKKREKLRLSQKEETEHLEDLAEIDPEAADEERIKLERQRAVERASLRHKNGSKWAKRMSEAGEVDEETRQAMMDRLKRHEELTRKISARDSDSDLDDAEDVTKEQLAEMLVQDMPRVEKMTGVFGMKFMQTAMEAKVRDAKDRIMADDDESSDVSHDVDAGVHVGGNEGRLKFGAQSSVQKIKSTVDPVDDGFYQAISEDDYEDTSNPWLAPTDSSKTTRTSNLRSASKTAKNDTARASKLLAKMGKAEAKHQAKATMDHETVKSIEPLPAPVVRDDTQDDEIDFLSQRQLIEMAFADDDLVTKEFEAEKNAEIDRDAPQVEDKTLPGWGDWSGAGITRNPRRKILVEKPGIKPDQRKDSKLAHVIMTEKMDKKFSKYLTSQVPYPYKSSDQYDLMMRTPMGREWNTQSSHRKLVKPRIETKKGAIIDPLKFTKVAPKSK